MEKLVKPNTAVVFNNIYGCPFTMLSLTLAKENITQSSNVSKGCLILYGSKNTAVDPPVSRILPSLQRPWRLSENDVQLIALRYLVGTA